MSDVARKHQPFEYSPLPAGEGDGAVAEEVAYLSAEKAIAAVYETNDGNENTESYMDRNGINSLCVLTVDEYRDALAEIERIWPRIKGKTVVEIGAGVGMLAIQMAKFAKKVYAIEADPAWAWVFVDRLYQVKPSNLTFIFGRAQELVGVLKADVAVIYTNSDIGGMWQLASQFAPEVIRGPLVPWNDRLIRTPEDAEFALRVARRIGLERFGKHGFTSDDLDAAIKEELEGAGKS